MKTKNNFMRTFCFVLIAIMTLSIMPFGLFDTVAKAQTKATEITSIYIKDANITPIIGKSAGESLNYTLPSNAQYTVMAHRWMDNTSELTSMNETDTFSEGRLYTRYWTLEATDKNVFTKDTAVYINGSKANVCPIRTRLNEADSTVYFVWSVETEACFEVKTIEISDAFIQPVIGAAAGDLLSYTLPLDASYYVLNSRWYNNTDNETMDVNDVFAAGKRYTQQWTLKSCYGYAFTKDTKVLINGSAANIYTGYTEINNSDSTMFYVWSIPSEAVAEGERIEINEIYIDNADIIPVTGKTAGDSLVYNLPADAPYTVNTTVWHCDTDRTQMSDSNVFEADKEYSHTWILDAKVGYTFTADTKVYINGSEANVDKTWTYMDKDDSTIFHVWISPTESIAESEQTEIEEIYINNAVVQPVIGNTAGKSLASELFSGAPYTITYNGWYNESDGTNIIDSAYKFEENTLYSHTWDLRASTGYIFTENTKVYINDSETYVDSEYTKPNGFGYVTGFTIWTLPTKSVTQIDEISIFDLTTQPIADQTAGDLLDYTLPEDAPYTVLSILWYNDTDECKMLYDDVFEAGKKYSSQWTFEANEGYIFNEDTNVLINGSAANVDTDYTEICDLDNSLFYVWTVSTEVAGECEIIDTININDANMTPIAGKKPGEIIDFTIPEDAPYTINYILWYNDTDECDMLDNDVFEAGKLYSFQWVFEANEGYTFTEDTKVLINGSAANVDTDNTKIDSADNTIFYVWTIPTKAVEEAEFELGDVNLDGKVNTGDAVFILRQISGAVTFTEEQTLLADFNGDGKVNTGDAVAILKHCVVI